MHGVDDAAQFVVAMRAVAGEHFHHARVKALLIGVQRIPGGQSLRARRELRILRHDAELLLTLERLLAIFIPALVELAFEFGDPFFRRVMRRMRRAGRDIEEIRLVGRDAFRLAHPGDGLIGDVGGQVIVRIGRSRNEIAILVEDWIPMVHVAAR